MRTVIPDTTSAGLRRAVFLCFFLSGASGLMYEIIWIRMLGLVFGHTVYAITTVLVAFMGGLGLGSYLGGRLADRTRDLLKIYGFLEIGIGLYCLLTPWLLEVVKPVYLGLARSMDLPFAVYTLIQFLLAALVIVIPTTLMGATLPILTRFSVRDLGAVGRLVGALYAVNTFGAVVGTYLVGFELLPALGMRATLIAAAALNITIGGVVLVIGRRPAMRAAMRADAAAEPATVRSPATIPALRPPVWMLMLGFALSGAASMVYEVAWTRALTLIIGSSTYAFSAMLVSFLVGIAAGSAWFARRATRPATIAGFAGLQIAIAVSAATVFPLFDQLPDLFLRGFRISQSPGFIRTLQLALSVAAMLAPTFCIGVTFPYVAQILTTDKARIGSQVGQAYAANTVGAIVGSAVAGFFLIPGIGVEATIRSGMGVNLAVGLALLTAGGLTTRARILAGAGVAAGIAAVAWLPSWDRQVMSSGVSVYASRYAARSPESSWRDSLRTERLLYYRDGISATVTVHRQATGQTILRVNGKTDASSVVDLHTQLMSGHLAALLHPDPKTAFVIGLGSGVTVGALAQHPLERIDVAEIEPAVIEASDFFRVENRRALSDPRVHVSPTDGRNFLLATPARYDLLVSEPSNPWIGGIATLFTVEFFDIARRHLAPDGIMVQWVHSYVMAPEDLRMVIASFRTAFPHATLWTTMPGDYLLIGTRSPLVVDLDRIRAVYAANPNLRHDLRQIKFPSPDVLLADFYLDEHDLGRLTAGARLNTDDRLPLEFSAPRNLYRDTIGLNADMLRAAKTSRFPTLSGRHLEEVNRPAAQFDLAIGLVAKHMYEEARQSLDDALAQNPEYTQALVLRGWLHKLANRFPEARQDFLTAIRINPRDAGAHQQLGLLYARQKNMDEAIAALRRAVELAPDNSTYVTDLADAIRQAPPKKQTPIPGGG